MPLERQPLEEKVGAFLVLPDLTEGDGTRTIAPRFFGTNGIPGGIHRYIYSDLPDLAGGFT